MHPTDSTPLPAEPARKPWTSPRIEALGDMRDVHSSQQISDDGQLAGSHAAS